MKKGKNQNYIIIGCIILIIVVITVLLTIRFYNSLQVQLFTERQSHLTEMTVKISEVIDVTIETMQENADSVKYYVEKNGINEENAADILQSLSEMLSVDKGVLLAMDNQGRYYSSEGIKGRWGSMEDLVLQENEPVIRDFVIFGQKQSCIVFMDKLDKEIVINEEGDTLSHVAFALPMDYLEDYLTISMFGDECYTYLINQDGRRLYKQTHSNRFIGNFNVLTALQVNEFVMGGDINDLIQSVENRELFCLEFKELESDENYFVSTVPVKDTNWTMMLFVPTKVLGVQTSEFTNSVIWYFSCFAAAAVVICCCVLFIIVTNRNDKKMIMQQEENNQLLARAAEEAKNANAAKSEFLAHMSHDIRTPINGILGMTNIAIKNKDNPERVDDCLHKISSAADHLLTLINDVLDMSSIESGKVVIAHKAMDIRLLINNCVSIIEGQLATRNVEFIKNFPELEHPYVYGDELHLRQIFINILGNAVKFTPEGGKIEFRVKELSYEKDKVSYRFEFEDTGIGISEEFQKKIFDEFSQEGTGGRSTYQGTGLGMAISKKFVELMDGDISVKSKLGEGTCFTVEIVFDVDYDYQTTKNYGRKNQIRGMKILLVEDNELNMEIAREILKEEGAEITEAENGQIALERFVSSKPGSFDVIIMDVMMPVMNGYDATRAIRSSSHPQAGSIPIIAMTANAYRQDVEMAMEAGMNAHVAKPINVKMLLSILGQYVKKG
jgi:signal transduction histidine kinase